MGGRLSAASTGSSVGELRRSGKQAGGSNGAAMTKVQIVFELDIPVPLETAYSNAQLDKLARNKGYEPHDD